MHIPRLFRYLIPILLIIAALWGWKVYSSSQDVAPPATVRVSRDTVQETVLATGIIEANQLVSVGARVSGQIAATRARLSQSKHDLVREEELLVSNFTSSENVEAARLNVQVYEADLEALQAQLCSAEVSVSNKQLALDRTSIHAPISGTVVAIVVDEGQTVNASQSTPTIVKIAELDTMLVKAEISGADIVQVSPGQAVVFSILGEPGHEFTAKVRKVEPAPSEIETSDTISSDEAVYYNAMLEVNNPEHTLRIGMTTQVSIILDSAEDVLSVPAAALQPGRQGSYQVQVYEPATGERTTKAVEVGLNNDVTAEIISALRAEDRIKAHFLGIHALTQQGERRANSCLFNRRTTQRGEMHGWPEM